jgi:hypothetical protein
MKICGSCKKEKPKAEFSKNASKKDGLQSNCKACDAEHQKEYQKENKEKIAEYQKEYQKENKEELIEHKKEYRKERYESDPLFRMICSCRARTRTTFKSQGIKKNQKTFDLIGCTPEFLRDYLASKFTLGMTLENHGEWHIDHIRPISSFDLTDPEQVKACFYYTNLQPLWGADNLQKSDKYEPA